MEPLIKGRIAEDGQTMDFPILEGGELKPYFRVEYHAYTKPIRDYYVSDNLVYLAVTSGTLLEFGEREIPIPFKEKGQIKDVRRFKTSSFSITIDGMALAKIHPGTPYKLKAPGGTSYHSFEMFNTPDSYKNPDEKHFDFVYQDEWKGLNFRERGRRVIEIPGALIFPDYYAYRLPGWLAREFNGSPEFGFAYSYFTEPRKEEVLHSHQEIMEPCLGLEGVVRLFVEIEGGSESLKVTDVHGIEKVYKGEIFELRKGDILVTMPYIPHRIIFDNAQYPFAQYCIHYASKNLDKIPADDRVILEKEQNK